MALDMDRAKADRVKLAASRAKGGGASARFWKPSVGKNMIRIMPPWVDKGDFKGSFNREVSQHWNVSPRGPILCPVGTPFITGTCPICDLVKKLRAKQNDVNAITQLKEIRAKKSFLVNMVDLEDPIYNANDVAEYKNKRPDSEVPFSAGDAKVQVYACPGGVLEDLLDAITENDHDITSLETGNDIVIVRTGTDVTTTYAVTPKMAPTPSDVTAEDKLPALDQIGFLIDSSEVLEMLTDCIQPDFLGLLPNKAPEALTAGTPKAEALGTGDTSSEEGTVDIADLERQMAAGSSAG